MVAGEDKLAAGLSGLDGIGTVEDIVESSANDDVLVKCGVRDEFGISFDGEGQFFVGFKFCNDFEK